MAVRREASRQRWHRVKTSETLEEGAARSAHNRASTRRLEAI